MTVWGTPVPMGAPVWDGQMGNYTPCQCPWQYSVSVAGAQGLREVETQCPEAWSYGQKAGALPRACRSLLAGRLVGLGGSFSPVSLIFSPGRACELLVDFCAPDLNPCQHEAQWGTPMGPGQLPISGARKGMGHHVTSSALPQPRFLTCQVGWLHSQSQGQDGGICGPTDPSLHHDLEWVA